VTINFDTLSVYGNVAIVAAILVNCIYKVFLLKLDTVGEKIFFLLAVLVVLIVLAIYALNRIKKMLYIKIKDKQKYAGFTAIYD